MKKYYYSIDVAKYICAILVLSIHTSSLEQISPLLNDLFGSIICRVAVPFFFIASSFFFFKKDGGIKQYAKYAKRLLLLYIIYNLIYVLIFGIQRWADNPMQLIQKIILTGVSGHLWFFTGLIVAVGIVTLLNNIISDKCILMISILTYCIGLILSTYNSLFWGIGFIKNATEIYMKYFLTVRNGILFGMLFVIIGKIIVVYEDKISRINTKKIILCLICSFFLLCLEGVCISKFTIRVCERELFLSLPIFATLLFIFVLKLNDKIRITNKKICNVIRNISTVFYGLHYVFIYILPIDRLFYKFIAIIIINTMISMIIVLVSKKVKILKYLY